MTIKLFEPYEIKNTILKNRIVMSPMCMYSADEDGFVTSWHPTHYEARAVGQVGLVFLEATAVLPEGRISNNDLGIWQDAQIDGLKQLATSIQRHGAKAAIQLGHAGRKATVPGEIFAPSANAYNEESKIPTAMTKEKLTELVKAFKKAAYRADQAGFDIIEIHAAHGYLINEFLSPLANKRNDEYGGSVENRYRILKEVVDEVKSVWNKPLFVRISANDFTEEGMKPADYIPMAKWMKEQGVDLIDVSAGAVVPAKIDSYPGYQVPFSETIKNGADISTSAVGLITSGVQAEEILRNERADLVMLGRALLRNPYWPYQAAKELNTTIQAPKQYKRGWRM
ncbi:NADPH dehydrogenase NamA [Tetragenococcus koreensis]|uniref:NADH-dependent flavin oxidoreductase n=1 Tax=Tetragenococcus koreensis TaxID=290335 RepID=A0AAN4ZR66_9ENTE|nr:NADPH dehydrogenase NamA [Tetragenococcus koreensis]AYW45110.1 NADPH dehydrogenase NamA [Tetragenococcus koreensis]MCF1584320.1 NADPH dehydrogenase NamA [Tetragenococcus koreensis]MCF1613869.1 NADPH dehydrogenase NamA [Tetragenococcus koreensis]MCF1616061.1 NADPH dehydrogenase NamA [Tetragenococcus koreensis]MCF1618587.1 NADPH dehydrogenase NamA [Tetragenococcus koreensis]